MKHFVSRKWQTVFFLLSMSLLSHGVENSLKISVQTKQVFPVVLSGKLLLEKGNGKVLKDSIQVRTSRGQVIPVQIDCRDERGNYVRGKNQYLAAEDEIVFLTLPEDGQKYEILYGDSKKKQAFSDPFTMKVSDAFVDLILTNADQLQIGIKASGARPNEEKKAVRAAEMKSSEQSGTNALPIEYLLQERRKQQTAPSKSAKGDYSKGGMMIFFRNWKLTDSNWQTMTVPVQPFGRNWDSPAWSVPEIAAAGPVRKIIRIRHEENIQNDVITNGLYLRKGIRGKVCVEHLFTIYAKTGIIDFSEVVEYAKADLGILLAYSFPLRIGKVPSKEQFLLIPDDLSKEKIRVVCQKDFLPGHLAKNTFYDLYTNPVHQKELPGYFGWLDRKSKIAAAVFYDPGTNQNETTSLSISCNIEVFNKNRGEAVSATLAKTVFVGKNNSGKPGTFRIRFRFFIDSTGDPENVRSAYLFWKNNSPSFSIGVK